MIRLTLLILTILLFTGCGYTRFSSVQEEMLIPNIDVDQTIKVSSWAMTRKDRDSLPNPQVLGFWAMRAQKITPAQAEEISEVYFRSIDHTTKSFALWHYTWAISDMYRLGDEQVKQALDQAHADAVKRAIAIDKANFVEGDKLLLGFFHGGGWAAATKYLVVPGNKKFPQSADEFFAEHAEEK